jgi:hypothetical protein
MTPVTAREPETVESLLAELIGVLARALSDADMAEQRAEQEMRQAREAELARYRANVAARKAAIGKQPMLPVAFALARAVAMRDQAGQEAILTRPRSLPEWRQLALALAGSADLAKLRGTPGPVPREKRAAA